MVSYISQGTQSITLILSIIVDRDNTLGKSKALEEDSYLCHWIQYDRYQNHIKISEDGDGRILIMKYDIHLENLLLFPIPCREENTYVT